jgi:hypothetical protein
MGGYAAPPRTEDTSNAADAATSASEDANVSDATGRGQGNQTSAKVVEQSNREEGIVRAGDTPIQHERPEDWGWHGEAGRTGRVFGWLLAVFLLLMMFGNHEGRVEDIYLVLASATIVVTLLWDMRRRKNAWRAR